jgi:hypothetical protein
MLNESDTVSLLPDTRALVPERHGLVVDERTNHRRTPGRIAPPLVALLAIAGTLMLRSSAAQSAPPTVAGLLSSPSSRTTPTAPPGLAVPGVLDIDSTPASYVLIDGRPLGATPRLREPVSPGAHVVAFVYAPGVSCQQSIDVSPGASAKVVDRLDAPSTQGRRCRGGVNDRK